MVPLMTQFFLDNLIIGAQRTGAALDLIVSHDFFFVPDYLAAGLTGLFESRGAGHVAGRHINPYFLNVEQVPYLHPFIGFELLLPPV